MATNKPNLSPEVKQRLRRAVLGELNAKSAKPVTPAARSITVEPVVAKPAPKTLKKILIKPKAEFKAPSRRRPVKKASAPLVKSFQKSVPPAPPVAKKLLSSPTQINQPSKPAVTTPIAKKFGFRQPRPSVRAWEKMPSEKSLETLFTKPSAPKKLPWQLTEPKKKVTEPSYGGIGQLKNFRQTIGSAPTKRHLLLKLLGLVVLLAALVLAVDILGLYFWSFRDPVSLQVAGTLQLPAGSVNSQTINLAQYLGDLKLLSQPLYQQREGLINYSGKSDVSDQVFYRLAAEKVVEQKLRDYNKTVTSSDVDNQMNLLLQQTSGQDQAEKIISNLYGLNLAQFRDKILLPMMEREVLLSALINDEFQPITKTAKDRADEVLKSALASSTNFEALAKQYSDDETTVNTGGDLGWAVKGQLDPSWEDLIFNTATGTVVKQVVKSRFGFHVIKVDQKLVDKATGAVSVKLRHILIKVDVDKYIKDLLDTSRLVKYVR